MSEFQVKQQDLTATRVVDATEVQALNSGEVRVKIDAFSFTANNITYWAMGEQLGYWQFFPATDNADKQWGIIPVWGFADVIESQHPEIPVGERLFGYFPTAKTWVMQPQQVNQALWFDGSAHRQKLPAGYNMYRRVAAEPNYQREHDALRMLLFPLHITSFCLHDMLASADWFGAEQLVITSASSKTSLGLAFALHEDSSAPPVVGMTSERNQAMVTTTNHYQQVISYDQLPNIDNSKKTVIVDMACNGDLLGRLHSHLGEQMRYCSNVGLTHWNQTEKGPGFNHQRSHMFFAPAHIQQRYQDWGATSFEQRSTAFMQRAAAACAQWLQIKQLDGLTGLAASFDAISQGQVPASQGLIIKM